MRQLQKYRYRSLLSCFRKTHAIRLAVVHLHVRCLFVVIIPVVAASRKNPEKVIYTQVRGCQGVDACGRKSREKSLKKVAKKFGGKEKRRTFAIPFGNGGTSRAARHTGKPF